MYTKEELQLKSLSDLLKIHFQAGITANDKEELDYFRMIKEVILENFTETPMVKYARAAAEVDAMNWPDNDDKDQIKASKYCAANIADHLDPMHINGMVSLIIIISELLELGESEKANLKYIKKINKEAKEFLESQKEK